MTAGIQIFNANKILQITNTYPQFFLRKSGRLDSSTEWVSTAKIGDTGGPAHVTAGNASYTKNVIDISYYNCPFVFFKASDLNARVTAYQTPSGSLVFGKWWNFNITGTIDYFIFDRWNPNERSKSGLQLWSPESKELIFDSGWHMLQILQVHEIPEKTPQFYQIGSDNAYEVETNIKDENIAVGLSNYRYIWIDANTGGSGGVNDAVGWYLSDCTWIEGSLAKVSYVIVELDFTNYGSQSSRYVNSKPTYMYVINTKNLPVPYDGDAFFIR